MEPSDAIMARFLALHPKLIDLSLGRLERLLAALGEPHKKLPPVIHVAGTNGKGSTVAFMRAILEAAGLVVHVYTSPHLVRFHERIRLERPAEGLWSPNGCWWMRFGAARRPMQVCRSPCSRSPRRPPSCSTPSIRRMFCCWRSGSAAGPTPRTSREAVGDGGDARFDGPFGVSRRHRGQDRF